MQIQEKVNQRGLDVTSFGAKGDGSNDIGAFEKCLPTPIKSKLSMYGWCIWDF